MRTADLFCRKRENVKRRLFFPERVLYNKSYAAKRSERSALIRASGRSLPDFMQEKRGQYEKIKNYIYIRYTRTFIS